ncbi:MAG: hypothetical protein GC164_08805 [Phycisphaera sp.]|nr:hypothetical protein [Phycisphaera sp.]
MTRACLIGVSGYGKVHYDMLLKAHASGDVAIVGATVINQDEEREKCQRLRAMGCRVFDDYRDMLKSLAGSADLCLIPTGTPLHKPMTVAALGAGMHVLVEKPAAGCLEGVRAMQAAAKAAGKRVIVGYQHLYTPLALGTKRAILDGRIGVIESIKCLVTWPRSHTYYRRNGWAGKLWVNGTAVNDSPFNNAVAHELMMMLFLAGATEREAAMPTGVEAKLYRANAIESADTATIHVQTREGVPIRFYCTHACRINFGPEVHIRGSGGMIVMTHRGATITAEGGESLNLSVEGENSSQSRMLTAVLSTLQGGGPFVCDLEMASRQTMVVDAIHKTATIQTVPGDTSVHSDGSPITFIPDIERKMREAFEQERMLESLT